MTIISNFDLSECACRYRRELDPWIDGYGKHAHRLPWDVRIPGESKYRAVYSCCYSNAGTVYVKKGRDWITLDGSWPTWRVVRLGTNDSALYVLHRVHGSGFLSVGLLPKYAVNGWVQPLGSEWPPRANDPVLFNTVADAIDCVGAGNIVERGERVPLAQPTDRG